MCLNPNFITDKGKFLGHPRFGYNSSIDSGLVFAVPCGHCVECLQDKANEWSYRVMREFEHCGRVGCVLTLTYDNNHLPFDGSVSRRDLQLFLKRLRKHIEPIRVRYFGCGEYGTNNGRPHYHLALIGWQPDDLLFVKKTKKNTYLYRSPTVDKLWQQGISGVAQVTAESVKYSAKYLQKLYFDETSGLTPPFLSMSTHPGFGAFEALERVKTDSIYVNGYRKKVPRYYLKVAERSGIDLSDIKETRIQTSKVMKDIKSDSLQKRRKKFQDKVFLDTVSKKYIDNGLEV